MQAVGLLDDFFISRKISRPTLYRTGSDSAMIEQAKKKNIPNATFVVGDCENFPFEKDSFDAIICSMSFHHYPDPQAFF